MTPFTFPFFDFHTICFDLCICSFLLQLVEFLLFSFSAVSVLTCFSFDEDTQTNTHTYTHTHTPAQLHFVLVSVIYICCFWQSKRKANKRV